MSFLVEHLCRTRSRRERNHSGAMMEPSFRIKQDPTEDQEKKRKEDFDDIAEPLNQGLLQRLDYFWILWLYESLNSPFFLR